MTARNDLENDDVDCLDLDFSIDHSKARSIAKTRWGTVNETYSTNRTGAYYFSCAGHGGYLCDPDAFSADEREAITEITSQPSVSVGVQMMDGDPEVKAWSNPYSKQRGSMHYSRDGGSYGWIDYPLYMGEEDCGWAVLVHASGLRITDDVYPDGADIEATAEGTVIRYYTHQAESDIVRTLKREMSKDGVGSVREALEHNMVRSATHNQLVAAMDEFDELSFGMDELAELHARHEVDGKDPSDHPEYDRMVEEQLEVLGRAVESLESGYETAEHTSVPPEKSEFIQSIRSELPESAPTTTPTVSP